MKANKGKLIKRSKAKRYLHINIDKETEETDGQKKDRERRGIVWPYLSHFKGLIRKSLTHS
jgi:hypothetical protein